MSLGLAFLALAVAFILGSPLWKNHRLIGVALVALILLLWLASLASLVAKTLTLTP